MRRSTPRPPPAPPFSRSFSGEGLRVWWLVSGLLCLLQTPASSQLRPLQPIPLRVMEAERTILLEVGLGLHDGQRASLAGTTGFLLEAGNFDLVWRSGRFALELGGTVRRFFEDASRFADPLPTVTSEGPRRTDAGEYRAATLIALTPMDRQALLLLRFGTRLPTTNDRIGIDRDRTDFFALLGGRVAGERWRLAGEAGLGINGTHDPRYEQADPLLHSATIDVDLGSVDLIATHVGHRVFSRSVQRGNESLAELRGGFRVGGRVWIQALHVRGLSTFSPESGWLITAGTTR